MGERSADGQTETRQEMKRAVFLDTSAWVSAAVRTQTHHAIAHAAYVDAVRQGYRIVTTPMVLGESHSLFLRLIGRDKARDAIDAVQRDPTHVVLPVDADLVAAAVERWIDRFRDQQLSLCDAVSFEIMKREGITRALSTDKHFVTAGFEIIG